MRLREKVAIVTGAASGFGEGIARRFAAEGARVCVVDLDAEAGAALAAELETGGARAAFVRADVSVGDEVKELAAAVVRSFGRVDILVNGANATHANQPMLNVPEAHFDRIFAVNCKSLYLTALHIVPLFRRQGAGVILNIASTAGVRPRPGLTWYNGSKGAAIVLTKSMAVELAPDGIRVNALNPVMGETDQLAAFMGAQDTPGNRARFIASIPLGRLSRASDIASAAVFFASDESEFVTGACLDVDGGRCI
jgi:3-oxoacyl-[acyl-carrier protein] reductase